MARNPQQEVALRCRNAISRDRTRLAFEEELAAISANPSALVTEKILYEAAGRSRATLNRYPDIKEKLAGIRAGRTPRSPGKHKADHELAGGEHRLRALQQTRTTLAQRVALLSVVIQDLERLNSSLLRLSQQHKVAISSRFVPS
nr:hypothetical protein [Klebsiella aerogenes]